MLKSGCQVEDLPLETFDRWDRALAVYRMVAGRLLDATHGSEQWSVPGGLADVQQRLAMIQAAKARWEAQAQARVAAAHSETVAQADATGKPAPPPPEEPATPDPRTQTRVTDPDSRIMRHSDPAFIQGATRRWRWMPTSRSFSRRP